MFSTVFVACVFFFNNRMWQAMTSSFYSDSLFLVLTYSFSVVTQFFKFYFQHCSPGNVAKWEMVWFYIFVCTVV